MTKIVITIEGGVITSVSSNDTDLQVVVCDLDAEGADEDRITRVDDERAILSVPDVDEWTNHVQEVFILAHKNPICVHCLEPIKEEEYEQTESGPAHLNAHLNACP